MSRGRGRDEGGVARSEPVRAVAARREAKDRQRGENGDLDLSDRSSRANVTSQELTSCSGNEHAVSSRAEVGTTERVSADFQGLRPLVPAAGLAPHDDRSSRATSGANRMKKII